MKRGGRRDERQFIDFLSSHHPFDTFHSDFFFFIMSELAFGVWTPPCSNISVDRNIETRSQEEQEVQVASLPRITTCSQSIINLNFRIQTQQLITLLLISRYKPQFTVLKTSLVVHEGFLHVYLENF